jgi:hypothetical protein
MLTANNLAECDLRVDRLVATARPGIEVATCG